MNKASQITWTAYLVCGIISVIVTSLAAADNVLVAAIQPPDRPDNFRNMDELNMYLDKLKKYYTIIGRPRFGKRGSMWEDAPSAEDSTIDGSPPRLPAPSRQSSAQSSQSAHELATPQFSSDPKDFELLLFRLLSKSVEQLAEIQGYDTDVYTRRRR